MIPADRHRKKTVAPSPMYSHVGKLLVPLVVPRQACNEMPANVQWLMEQVKARASGALA